MLCCFRGTATAGAQDIDAHAFGAKPLRQTSLKLDWAKCIGIDVEDRLANHAHQVMVRLEPRINPQRAMVRTYFAQHATLHEGVEVLVDSGQRDRRDLVANALIHLFRRIVPVLGHHGLKDDLALMSGRQIVLPAHVPELFMRDAHD